MLHLCTHNHVHDIINKDNVHNDQNWCHFHFTLVVSHIQTTNWNIILMRTHVFIQSTIHNVCAVYSIFIVLAIHSVSHFTFLSYDHRYNGFNENNERERKTKTLTLQWFRVRGVKCIMHHLPFAMDIVLTRTRTRIFISIVLI